MPGWIPGAVGIFHINLNQIIGEELPGRMGGPGRVMVARSGVFFPIR
jgi:hypothetical protein